MDGMKKGKRARQQGTVLVVSLILLAVMTLLAVTALSTVAAELVMAGNEQHRESASQAAAAGIEYALAALALLPVPGGSTPEPLSGGPTSEKYSAMTRYAGVEKGLPQSSVDRFIGHHYVIESIGTSLRNATETQVQGAMMIAAADEASATFGQIGTGLQP